MAITTHWASPPQNLLDSLTPGVVHIWRAPLDDSAERASRYRVHLSQAELDRADRCRTPQPQFQFIITRGILRILLSRYMEVLPTQVHFDTGPHGKPILVNPSSIPIQFNVSHARGMALIALTLQHAIGVDVEWVDRNVQDEDIATRFFSARESEYLRSLAPPERILQFFSYWTCKEAYLKMQGRGIGEGLAHCELTMHPDQLQVGFTSLDQQGQGKDCILYRITAGTGHIGAVAIACSSAQILYWNWPEEFLP